LAKSFFDSAVVEDGKCNRCFPDPPCTNESDGFEVFGEPSDLLDQVIAPKTVSWRRRRRFTKRDAIKL
jgi:hypothetical protein